MKKKNVKKTEQKNVSIFNIGRQKKKEEEKKQRTSQNSDCNRCLNKEKHTCIKSIHVI